MKPELFDNKIYKNIVNRYKNKPNDNNNIFNLGIILLFVIITGCYLSYKYREKNNISFN